MELDKKVSGGKPDAARGKRAASMNGASVKNDGRQPGWANGLRQIYDTVVDEPLPDAFRDLLSKLDDPR